MAGSARFDPVTLEVLWTRLISTADEAAAALVRTSFSTVVRESNDFACVLTDARGYSLVQATDSIPSFIGTVPRTIREFLREYPAQSLAPGDVLATNDIWLGTGHLPDITVAKPIFRDGVLVGFAGSVAHAPDIGGRIRSADSREVYEEGLQIPPLKVVHAGVPDETFLRLLRKNVRVPDQVVGDLFAQFSALDLMERRVLALMRSHGLDDLALLAEEIQWRSEQAMRKAIREVPDGVYRHETITDGFEQPVLRDAFEQTYATVFGRWPPVAEVEIVNIRVCATATAGRGQLSLGLAEAQSQPQPRTTRTIVLGQGAAPQTAPVYERSTLPAGMRLAGPALVEEASSTLLVPAGATATMQASGNIVVELPES
ncbi:MAG: hypothetical protein GEV05_01365 [Betaproteobacteria bacterium]|nr:hypothetical protein [Betaproteobacteria bacterium]